LISNCSGLSGDCTGLYGDIDSCDISEEERKKGINILDLVEMTKYEKVYEGLL
jgi:hypothetical protein